MSEPIDGGRYDRQIMLFGALGQERIARATVGVLGLGGLGSHVCQQLAYLGVTHFVIADNDEVKKSNLNRLIGATEVDLGRQKTEISRRMVEHIQPAAEIHIVNEKLPSQAISAAIGNVDVVVGCFDGDWPRLMTTSLSAELGVPYIDAATDVVIDGDDVFYGGHVVVAGRSPGCLLCRGMLSQDAIRREQMSDAELVREAEIYGVPVETLRSAGPSVVTLNGVIASLACTEVMAVLTGLPIGKDLQYYRGEAKRITTSRDNPQQACYYCDQWLGR